MMMMMTITMIIARQKGKLLCWDVVAVYPLISSYLQYATASVDAVAELTATCLAPAYLVDDCQFVD